MAGHGQSWTALAKHGREGPALGPKQGVALGPDHNLPVVASLIPIDAMSCFAYWWVRRQPLLQY